MAPSRIAKIVFVFGYYSALFYFLYLSAFFISTPEIPEEELTPKPIVENEIVEPRKKSKKSLIFLVLSCIDDRCWVEVIDAEDNYLYRAIMTKGEEISFTNLNWVF